MHTLAEAEFDDMVAAQNEEMRSLHFQIKRLKHPQDKKVYISLVNTVSSAWCPRNWSLACTALHSAATDFKGWPTGWRREGAW